jgi:hypothetical protein
MITPKGLNTYLDSIGPGISKRLPLVCVEI